MSKALAERIKKRYDALKAARQPWECLWSEIAQYAMPRRMPGLNGTVQTVSADNETRLFDTTAVHAGQTLANGQLAWMSPLEASWFAFQPQGSWRQKNDDEARMWLSDVTSTARDELAISNFYTAVHEFYWDRGVFGTGALFIDEGQKFAINAQHWPVGTFVIDESADGLIDTVIREFQLTARQAVQKFGESNVSEKIQKAIRAGGAKEHEKFWFLHAIYPREDAERDKVKLDDVNMPIACVYVERDDIQVNRVSGYHEMPVMVSRYLEWGTGAGGFYGWSPAWAALPEARQLNFIQKMGDALAEKAAFPPILAHEELEGEIDANANGVTYFSPGLAGGGPQLIEWGNKGQYNILLDRIKMRQEAVKEAFHVDLFQMFAQLNKQMTAREVMERSQEKLIQFSPTFSRLTSELFNPLLQRTFGMLLRSGKLGMPNEIPQSLLRPGPNGMADVTPSIQYSSRIALSLRSLPALGWYRTVERVGAVAQLNPGVLDNYDFDKAERTVAILDGVPPDFFRTETQRDEMRTQRAEQEAAAAQQQQQLLLADAVSKVGKVPADSPVGKVIESQIPRAA